VRIIPDTTTLPSTPTTDILILPGGAPGAATFAADAGVQRLIRAYRGGGRATAFICAATTALAAAVAGADNKDGEAARRVRVTSHPAVKEQLVAAGWEYAPDAERVVVDGGVITSRGPGTALLFALTIVEVLCGAAKREEVAGPLICASEL